MPPCRAAPRNCGRVGDYTVLREVGRGGMGVVYEAVQESLGRRVALKVLPATALADARAWSGSAARRGRRPGCTTPNIVPVFGVGEHDGMHYYAMQFIPGQGLDAVLDELRRLRRAGPGRPPATARAEPGRRAACCRVSWPPAARARTGRPRRRRPRRSCAAGVRPVSAARCPAGPELSGVGDRTDAPLLPRAWPGSACRRPRRWPTPTRRASSTATSSRANLLLDAPGVVWVTDFGLAKAEERRPDARPATSSARCATWPRSGSAASATPAPTCTRLGLTLYELLTLRPAFDSPDRLRLIQQVKDRNRSGRARSTRGTPRPGDDRPEGDREGAGTALPHGGRAGGRPGAVPGRRADQGPAGRRAGAGLEVGAAEPLAGRVAGGGGAVPGRRHARLAGLRLRGRQGPHLRRGEGGGGEYGAGQRRPRRGEGAAAGGPSAVRPGAGAVREGRGGRRRPLAAGGPEDRPGGRQGLPPRRPHQPGRLGRHDAGPAAHDPARPCPPQRRVQPRRPGRGHLQRGRDGPGPGGEDREADPRAAPPGSRGLGVLQPRRQDHRGREIRLRRGQSCRGGLPVGRRRWTAPGHAESDRRGAVA